MLYALEAQEIVYGSGASHSYIFFEWGFWNDTQHEEYKTFSGFFHETCHVNGADDLDTDEVIIADAKHWEGGHYPSVQIYPTTFELINLNKVRFDGPT